MKKRYHILDILMIIFTVIMGVVVVPVDWILYFNGAEDIKIIPSLAACIFDTVAFVVLFIACFLV